jgi:hypothetical protein
MDIDFICRDPTMRIPFPDEEFEFWYPVELNRISGTDKEKSHYIIKNKWFIFAKKNKTPNRNRPLAKTFSVDAEGREWQKIFTGSDNPWSDIMLLDVLSDTRNDQGRVKDVVKDWSINSLVERKFTLFNLHTATMAVMHELTHSIAMGIGNEIGM